MDESGGPETPVYEAGGKIPQEAGEPLAVSLEQSAEEVTRLRVRFRTATELKSGKRLAERPHFRVLFNRARDRAHVLAGLAVGA